MAHGIPSYFIVMIDYGRKGREAIVDPEVTRRDVVANLKAGEYGPIAFIHHVDDGLVEDVTNDILKEAGFYEAPPCEIMERFDGLIRDLLAPPVMTSTEYNATLRDISEVMSNA